MNSLRINHTRLHKHLSKLAKIGKDPNGGITRIAYTDADLQGRAYVIDLMKSAHLQVSIDNAGNILGNRGGKDSSKPCIAFGSHIDTVPNGGMFDGSTGVLGAVEVIQTLNDNNIKTEYPLEVIVFSNEENGLVGSRVMAGNFNSSLLTEISHTGLTFRENIKYLGGNPEKIQAREKGEIAAFIELHIEQGVTLEKKKTQIGVVHGIAGIRMWEITVEGSANHAGTTPMNMRKDALLASARLITMINDVVKSTPGDEVATVGQISVDPGAHNVIPGNAVLSLEIRDLSMDKIEALFTSIDKQTDEIEKSTGTSIRFRKLDLSAAPAIMDGNIKKIIASSAEKLGLSSMMMPSGAGHDAQEIARIAPAGMIFVPSEKGVSHSPEEFTKKEDITNGVNVLLHTVLSLDKEF